MSFLILSPAYGTTGPATVRCTGCGDSAPVPYGGTVGIHTCDVKAAPTGIPEHVLVVVGGSHYPGRGADELTIVALICNCGWEKKYHPSKGVQMEILIDAMEAHRAGKLGR